MNYLNFFSQQDKMISIEVSNGKEIQKSQSHMIRTLDAKELQTISGGCHFIITGVTFV